MHMHTYRDGSLNTVGASLKVAADFVAATPPCAHSELDVYRSSGESMTSHSMRARAKRRTRSIRWYLLAAAAVLDVKVELISSTLRS